MNTDQSRLLVRLLGTAAAAALAFGSNVAYAADATGAAEAADPSGAAEAPADNSGLGDIVVTARKVEEKLQDIPVAVTAFSGDTLKSQNAVSVADISRFTPGFLSLQGSNNPTVLVLSIRGQIQTDNLATLEPSVGTYIDGVYAARSYGLNGDLIDIQSVQVLKGPQGTLFGRNTSAGAVLIETKKPNLTKASAEVSATYGRYNQFVGSAIINVPLVNDQLAFRGAIQYNRRDGYVTDVISGAKYNNVDNLTGRAKLLWEPAPNVSILAQGDWFTYKSNGPARVASYAGPNYLVNSPAALVSAGALPDCSLAANAFTCAPVPTYGALVDFGLLSGPPFNLSAPTLAAFGIHSFPQNFAYYSQLGTNSPNLTAVDTPPLTDTKTQSYSLTAAVDTGLGTFKVIGGYRKVKAIAAVDLDGTPYQILQTTGIQDLHQWSIEGQLTGSTQNKAFVYALGVTYFTEAGLDSSYSATLVPLSAPGYYEGDINNKSVGIYGQGTFHVTDRLSLTGGLRWSEDRKGLITHNQSLVPLALTPAACALAAATFVPGAPASQNCTLGHNDTFRQLSYLASVDYKVTPDILIYAKMSKGYRSGGENLRANGDAATFNPFKPEVNYEEEIGFKSEFLDHKVRLNVSAYFNKVHNAQRSQLLAVTSGPLAGALLTSLGNAQRVRNMGVEADLQIALTPDLTLQASGNLNDSKYLQYDVPASFGSAVLSDHRSEFFAAAPKGSYTVAGNYKHNFGGVTVSARVDYSWMASYHNSTDACGAYPIPGAGFPCVPLPAAEIAAMLTPAAGILGARLGASFDDDRFSIAIWGRNLTDNRDFVSGFNVSPFGLSSSIHREPVTYGMTVTAKF